MSWIHVFEGLALILAGAALLYSWRVARARRSAELDRIEAQVRELLLRRYYTHASLGNLRALFERYQNQRESLASQAEVLKRPWHTDSRLLNRLLEETFRLKLPDLAQGQSPHFLRLIEHVSNTLEVEAGLGAEGARALQGRDEQTAALARVITEAEMNSLPRQFEQYRIDLRKLHDESLVEMESLPTLEVQRSRLRERRRNDQLNTIAEAEAATPAYKATVRLDRARSEVEKRLGQERKQREHLLDELEAELRQREDQLKKLAGERERLEERLSLLEASARHPFQPVLFQSLWPRHVWPAEWQSLLFYLARGPQGLAEVEADARRRFRVLPDSWAVSASEARRPISQGTLVTIVPELPGFRFNPPVGTVQWLEDWHCVEFRMQAEPEASPGRIIEGRIAVFVGPLLIGEIDLEVEILDANSASSMPLREPRGPPGLAVPYRSIFVSYSHADSEIVNRLQMAYKALGDSYLRDVEIIRSGETWSSVLLAKIKAADIFSALLVEPARDSGFVEKEWRHALTLERERFIRPMFWRKPLPPPPAELAEIHFTYVEMDPGPP